MVDDILQFLESSELSDFLFPFKVLFIVISIAFIFAIFYYYIKVGFLVATNKRRINDFLSFQKFDSKKILTQRAKKMALDKLEKLSGGNEELAIEILQQSIFKCWQDLYPLNDDGGTVEGKKDILTPEGLQKNIDKWGLSE